MHEFLPVILQLHDEIRDAVVAASVSLSHRELSAVAAEEKGDTIYAIDRVSEDLVIERLSELAEKDALCLIMEGLPGGKVILPEGVAESECRWRIIIDPIDGTRGIMYQKRSAWILTGVAPDRGSDSRLRDIQLAVQTEIPLAKQYLSDQIWVIRDGRVKARRYDRIQREWQTLNLQPSTAKNIHHGFSTVSRFFPGTRDILAAIDDEIVFEVLGPPRDGKAACFEDQYACTGGQLYELMAGHDRFIADLRSLMESVYDERGLARGLCCHPYDLCTVLIAQELGIPVTDPRGQSLDAPLDVETDVSWVGYANEHIRAQVEPALHRALMKRGLLQYPAEE